MVAAQLGDPTVELNFRALFNALTTGKLDLFASWTETIDDPAVVPEGPKQITGNAHVAELRLEPPTPTAAATNSATLQAQHNFGDTKFRSVDYFLRGTTAFREYFPPQVTADPKNLTRDGPKVTNVVANRARPAAPKPLYVIPTFGWDPKRPLTRLVPGGSVTSRRLGGGLRVYLDRPWYSSGDGELLGVVLRAGGQGLASDSDPMKNVITSWGGDPMFASDAPPTNASGQGPAVENFAGQQQVGRNLVLAEQPPPPQATGWTEVDVVGYEVQYHAERKLWYADIQMDPGTSYCPFIRLALARYQSNSVSLAELLLAAAKS